MRITDSMLTNGFLRSMRSNLSGLDEIQRKLYTKKEINRPSDDPVGLQQILNLGTAQDQTEQYLRNIDNAGSYLATTEGALKQAMALVDRAKVIANGAANGANDTDAEKAYAQEIEQLLRQLVEAANSVHTGRYLFGGSDTTQKPYSINEDPNSPDYLKVTAHSAAPQGKIMYEVGPGVKMAVNLTGTDAFGDLATGNDAFTALRELAAAMRSEDKKAIEDAWDKLDKAGERMLTSRTELGARTNRLDATEERYQDDLINIITLRSKSEDVDVAKVIMDLKAQESVYQAALAAGARIMMPSLVDFLR